MGEDVGVPNKSPAGVVFQFYSWDSIIELTVISMINVMFYMCLGGMYSCFSRMLILLTQIYS